MRAVTKRTSAGPLTVERQTLSLGKHPLYAPCMKHVRALFERLRGGRRPPTGPLTTAEKATADELRTQTSLKDSARSTSTKNDA